LNLWCLPCLYKFITNSAYLLEFLYIDVELTTQFRLGLREGRYLTRQLLRLVRFLLLCFALSLITRLLILYLKLFHPQDGLKLRFTHLVLLDEGFELGAKPAWRVIATVNDVLSPYDGCTGLYLQTVLLDVRRQFLRPLVLSDNVLHILYHSFEFVMQLQSHLRLVVEDALVLLLMLDDH